MPVGTTSEVNRDGFDVSEGHHESERNGGFRPHPLAATKDIRAARGHAAAAPPSSVMKSRRLVGAGDEVIRSSLRVPDRAMPG
jgi:hypothetical protein